MSAFDVHRHALGISTSAATPKGLRWRASKSGTRRRSAAKIRPLYSPLGSRFMERASQGTNASPSLGLPQPMTMSAAPGCLLDLEA
jgi:hypothetical protein